MSANNIENFFTQDEVAKDITSFSVGEVWLYFYKEQLIGIRDLEANKAVFLKAENPPPEEDGYTHRHEITDAIVEGVIEEAYSTPETKVSYENITDLSNTAFGWVSESLGKNIDAVLLPNSSDENS